MHTLLPLALLLLFLCPAPNAWGQKNAVVKKVAKTITKRAPYAAKTRAAAAAKKLPSVLAQTDAAARKAALANQAERSVFILEGSDTEFLSTGFVIAEEFDGKTYLWGVTASHLIDMYDDTPLMMFRINNHPVSFTPVTILKGHKDGADIALLLLPQQATQKVKPMSVSPFLPKTGQTSFSVGYALGKFTKADKRKILEANPFRLVTSFELQHMPRRGYCGSPLLNTSNEVIGVHCGSNLLKQADPAWRTDLKRHGVQVPDISLAVPISRAYDLLAAYRSHTQQGILMKAFNIPVGTLLPHQHILQVAVFKNKYLQQSINGGPYIDPSHLERFLKTEGADGLLITVYDPGTPAEGCRIIDYIVNLATKEIKQLPRNASAARSVPFRAKKTR